MKRTEDCEMRTLQNENEQSKLGFTLTEVLVVMLITGLIIAGSVASLWQIQRLWKVCEIELEGTGEAALALQKMVSGCYGNPGLRMAEWNSSVPTPRVVTTNGGPHRIEFTYNGGSYYYQYDGGNQITDQDGVVICDNVAQPFSFSVYQSGVVKIDLGLYRIGAFTSTRYIRLATWVALRNR